MKETGDSREGRLHEFWPHIDRKEAVRHTGRNFFRWRCGRGGGAGFSLVEALVATSILGLILVVMLSMVNQTSGVWRSANSRIEAFQGARRAFDTLVGLLSQATLNTYWGYDNENNPTRYVRKSELHFVVEPTGGSFPGTPGCGQGVFFQAPAGRAKDGSYERLTGLLNLCGFYVEYGSDQDWLPGPPINAVSKDRFRLMLWLANTDVDSTGSKKPVIFRTNDDTSSDTDWIAPNSSDTYPLADNIIALLIWPRDEQSSGALDSYSYNSRMGIGSNPQPVTANQLPPVLEVAMVAIDEPSAVRLGPQLKGTIDSCLSGLFAGNPAATFADDLKELGNRLADRGITHRVFSSAVPLREAKWSAQ
jgi:uncharacterized protein (TIGR02599 family)